MICVPAGAVVICSPLGRDYLRAHYALRRTAVRLTELGFCVVRFDYDGTGDSAGEGSDPDRLEAWFSGISEALRLVRDAGVNWVALAGMRSGALLASVAAERDGAIDSLRSGRPDPDRPVVRLRATSDGSDGTRCESKPRRRIDRNSRVSSTTQRPSLT